MAFLYPENPATWQTAYTRDDAYRHFGKYAQHYKYIFLASSGIVAAFIAIQFSPSLDQLVSRYLGKSTALTTASILMAFLGAMVAVYIALGFVRSRAFRFASMFFTDFHQPPEGIDPVEVIKYRLNGKFKLPPPFTMIFQFKYIMAKEGEIVKADQWPAWMARTLGGPITLIVFDGCALYLERGNRFSRVVGPGDKVPFLEWYETIKYVVDLRPKVREDKFDVWTKDGIKIEVKARIECRIGDPKKKDPDSKLVYPYDPIAVQKAIERYALRWPSCPEGEPSESTWIDAAWGQVTGIVPHYIGSRTLDDLFMENRKSGQIFSPNAVQEIFNVLNNATNGFGVYIIDFQVLEIKIPPEVEEYQKEYWKAEKQSIATLLDGKTKAFNIRTREKARAEAQYDLILAIAEGLEKNKSENYVEPLLLSLSGILDESLREPLTRAYLAKETLDILEQLQSLLEKDKTEAKAPDTEKDTSPIVDEIPKSDKRLLNAGFSDRHSIIKPYQALRSNKEYDLLVDIGPLWKDEISLVVKNPEAYFPEKYLPSESKGYIVRVVFISEDFTPPLSSAEIWVPSKPTQSHPYIKNKPALKPSPVNLPVITPKIQLPDSEKRAYGRLCFYYKGQLIQSAQVSVGISETGALTLQEPNKIQVDYVLTTNLSEKLEKIGDRNIKIQSNYERPISANITLNDDGSGRHRILATYYSESKEDAIFSPAWQSYDPNSTQKVLESFREVLSSCSKRLGNSLEKNKKDFYYNMRDLAILGDKLYVSALSGINVGAWQSPAKWKEGLLKVLRKSGVIQIARTGPANYVFPWALIYDYPLTNRNELKACPVFDEWNEAGFRDSDLETSCPYADMPWHKENIICPYGFWGLKHIIEQPTISLRNNNGIYYLDASDKVTCSTYKKPNLSIAITFDIDQTAASLHIKRLADNMKASLKPPNPAMDRRTTLKMLQSPEFVYFLCHGDIDPDRTPFISIGEHQDHLEYKIYPGTLDQWSRLPKSQDGLDLDAWQNTRPLVFINGCHTLQMQPGIVLNFLTAFSDLGASAIIGTEVSMRADMAMAVAETIFLRVANGMEIGQAVREMRWEFVNRGNLLGLAYTPYSLANLHIEYKTEKGIGVKNSNSLDFQSNARQ